MKRATGMAQPLFSQGHQVGIIAWDTPANRTRLKNECPHAEPLWIAPGMRCDQELRMKIARLRVWCPDVTYVCAYSIRNLITKFSMHSHCRVVIEQTELHSAIPSMRKRFLWELLLEYIAVLGSDGLLCASRYLTDVYTRRARAMGRTHLPIQYFPYAYSAPSAADPARIAELRQHVAGRKVVLYMGTLVAFYGIFNVLHAAALLLKRRHDFKLVVLGHGQDAEQAHTMAKQLGLGDAVQFCGYATDEDMVAWFSLADVFLAPLNNTVQDLARCPSKVYMYLPFRKPIVTCPIGDPHDLLGEDGFYYPAGDVNGMSLAIDRALSAASTWMPSHVDPQQHDWTFRSREFLAWIEANGWNKPMTTSRL